MNSEFYLLNKSFATPESIEIEDLTERLRILEEDYMFIRSSANDIIKKHESIYEQIIFDDLTVMDILYNGKGKGVFDRDMISQLRNIVDKAIEDNIEPQEVIDILLHSRDENTVYGLLCLHEIENIDEKYLVYNKNNWLSFHRYFLSVYPKNVDFFVEECEKYFPNIYLHERNKQTIQHIFKDFSKKIIEHLTHLNDSFSHCKILVTTQEGIKKD